MREAVVESLPSCVSGALLPPISTSRSRSPAWNARKKKTSEPKSSKLIVPRTNWLCKTQTPIEPSQSGLLKPLTAVSPSLWQSSERRKKQRGSIEKIPAPQHWTVRTLAESRHIVCLLEGTSLTSIALMSRLPCCVWFESETGSIKLCWTRLSNRDCREVLKWKRRSV